MVERIFKRPPHPPPPHKNKTQAKKTKLPPPPPPPTVLITNMMTYKYKLPKTDTVNRRPETESDRPRETL